MQFMSCGHQNSSTFFDNSPHHNPEYNNIIFIILVSCLMEKMLRKLSEKLKHNEDVNLLTLNLTHSVPLISVP